MRHTLTEAAFKDCSPKIFLMKGDQKVKCLTKLLQCVCTSLETSIFNLLDIVAKFGIPFLKSLHSSNRAILQIVHCSHCLLRDAICALYSVHLLRKLYKHVVHRVIHCLMEINLVTDGFQHCTKYFVEVMIKGNARFPLMVVEVSAI